MNAVSMLAIAFAAAGCGMSSFDADDNPGVCAVSLTYSPSEPPPIAGPSTTIRVSAVVDYLPGVPSYDWRVVLDGSPLAVTYAQPDHSQIEFVAAVPGIYEVSLNFAVPSCRAQDLSINVGASGALSGRVRLRVVPPQGIAAPPHEEVLVILGGASSDVGVVRVDRGVAASPTVLGPSGGVPAYVRFAPTGSPGAVVEAFSDGGGRIATRLSPGFQAVLIVPTDGVTAPRRLPVWQPGAAVLALDAGAPVTGTVQDPDGNGLAGATVQLSVDGVPSTLATTAGASGAFALSAALGSGPATVTVTPPAGSGLPRLSATSQTFTFGAPIAIRYAPGLVRRDLAGLRVRRGAPAPGAKLVVVGRLQDAGRITAGTAATAAGEVRIAVTADATGTLPSAMVPAAELSAVISVAPDDLAVAALDTRTAVPASLEAPAMESTTTVVRDAGGVGLAGAVLDLVPAGALAMAAAPPIHVVTGASGAITVARASGGHYDLRFHDPARRGAPLVVTDRATVDASYLLPPALELRGSLLLGGLQTLANASVQILCEDCTGIDRAKPIAETSSDETGRFQLAVPDPGKM